MVRLLILKFDWTFQVFEFFFSLCMCFCHALKLWATAKHKNILLVSVKIHLDGTVGCSSPSCVP